MQPVCKRGHPRTPWNIRWNIRSDGRRYSICKPCQCFRHKLKYRKDDAFREREKQRTRENYHRRKEQPACQP